MVRTRVVATAVAVAVLAAACGEAAGREPPDGVRGEAEYERSGFQCERGTVPAESVWYPPTQVIVVGADAVAASETRFSCPDYVSSGTFELLEVATDTRSLDIYVDGATARHGVDELRAMLYPLANEPRSAEVVNLEPDWYRIDVPEAAERWIVRLDLLTELGWESSYAFRVTALR